MKAIVLGATGFIGSHIARALVGAGIDVRILRRSTSPSLALEGLKVEEVVGDLNDRDSLIKGMKGCDALFNAAGYYPIYSFDRDHQKSIALRQMRNVLEAFEESGVSKFVYTSSMSTIGKNPDGPSNEETPYDPEYFTGLYYEIKYLLEQEILKYTRRGFHIVMVNPTGVFGDYDVKPTSGTLVVEIANKKVPAIIQAKMNAVDVRDVGKGHVAALLKGCSGTHYILGNHNTTVWDVAHLIAKLAGVPPPKFKIPLAAATVAAHLSEYLGKYLLHREKPFLPLVGIDFLKYGMHYDTSRARNELGFTSTPLEETIEREIRWFRKHHYIRY